MDIYKGFLLIGLILCITSFLIGGQSLKEGPFDNVEMLNKEIINEVMKPNDIGYEYLGMACPFEGYTHVRIPDYPALVDSGLTFYLFICPSIETDPITEPRESLPIFKKIYADALKRFNAIRPIRPFLAEFPLTPSCCGLFLKFTDKEKQIRKPPYVGTIRKMGETIEINPWDSWDKSEKAPSNVNIRVPVQEELKELYTPQLPPKQPGPKPKIPPLTRLSWRYNNPFGKSLFKFLTQFCQKQHLEITILGKVEPNVSFKDFSFALRGSQTLSLDEARKLAATCSKELLQYARTDPDAIAFMKQRSTERVVKDAATVAEPRHCAFRISFWNEDIDRIPAPAIAEIRVIGESFQYFTADKDQRLVLALEETRADAMAFLDPENTKPSIDAVSEF